jgi:hypothetical protein
MTMISHETNNTSTGPSRYEEVTRLSADVSVVYPDMLANPEYRTGYSAELGSLDDSRIAQLVTKGIEYRERFASGNNDKYFDVHISPQNPDYITNRDLGTAKSEQYKLLALSTLLGNGILYEGALKAALEHVQGDEFLESALHNAVGVITDYAHTGRVFGFGGTGLDKGSSEPN